MYAKGHPPPFTSSNRGGRLLKGVLGTDCTAPHPLPSLDTSFSSRLLVRLGQRRNNMHPRNLTACHESSRRSWRCSAAQDHFSDGAGDDTVAEEEASTIAERLTTHSQASTSGAANQVSSNGAGEAAQQGVRPANGSHRVLSPRTSPQRRVMQRTEVPRTLHAPPPQPPAPPQPAEVQWEQVTPVKPAPPPTVPLRPAPTPPGPQPERSRTPQERMSRDAPQAPANSNPADEPAAAQVAQGLEVLQRPEPMAKPSPGEEAPAHRANATTRAPRVGWNSADPPALRPPWPAGSAQLAAQQSTWRPGGGFDSRPSKKLGRKRTGYVNANELRSEEAFNRQQGAGDVWLRGVAKRIMGRLLTEPGSDDDAQQHQDTQLAADLIALLPEPAMFHAQPAAAAEVVDFGSALKAQAEFNNLQEAPSKFALVDLFRELAHQGGVEVAMSIWDIMDGCGRGYPTRELEIFNALLRMCEQRGDPTHVATLLQQIQSFGLRPDHYSYHHAMGAHAKCGRIAETMQLFQEMKVAGLLQDEQAYTMLIMAHEKGGRWEDALEAFVACRRAGQAPTTYTYRALISALAMASQIELAFQALQWMEEDGVQANEFVYSTLLLACLEAEKSQHRGQAGLGRCGEVLALVADRGASLNPQAIQRILTWALANDGEAQAVPLFKEIRAAGVFTCGPAHVHKGRTSTTLHVLYHKLLKILLAARQWHYGTQVYRWMCEDRVQPNPVLYEKLVAVLQRDGAWSACVAAAEELAAANMAPTPQLLADLLIALAGAGRWEEVLPRLERVPAVLEEPGCLEARHYNILISSAGRTGALTEALKVFDYMIQHGQAPGVLTFNHLIDACHYAQDVDAAFRQYERMQNSGLKGDAYTFSLLIKNCLRVRDWRRAERVWRWMEEQGVQPDAAVYNCMISAYERGEQVDKALAMFETMLAAGLEANAMTYAAMCEVFQKQGRWDKLRTALQVKEWMEAQGVDPQHVTYAELIERCGEGGRWQEALEHFEGLESLGLRPDVQTWSTIIQALGGAGQVEGALRMKARMEADGVRPNLTTYNNLLGACTAARRLDLALEVLEEMKTVGPAPDVVSYTKVIGCCNVCDSDWRTALRLFTEMMAAGVPANTVTYNSLISVFASADQWQTAMQVFRYMQDQAGVVPDAATYQNLVDTLSRCGRWDGAVKLYLQAMRKGCLPGFESDLSSPKSGSLDMHGHSEQSGEVMLRAWLAHLRHNATQGRRAVNPAFAIITGYGKGGMHPPKLKPMAARLLSGGLGVAVKFVVTEQNPGAFYIAAEDMYAWLEDSRLDLGC